MENEENNKIIGDINIARQSLIDELLAQKRYDEGIIASNNKDLAGILEHNRDDEKEHAALLIEWIRRNDMPLDKELKEILFKKDEFIDLWD